MTLSLIEWLEFIYNTFHFILNYLSRLSMQLKADFLYCPAK